LRSGTIHLHKKYVKEELKNDSGDFDVHREYANRRKYLENSINYLRQMLQKDQDVHKQENTRIMKENVMLLQEINILRKDVHHMRYQLKLGENGQGRQNNVSMSSMSTKSRASSANSNSQRAFIRFRPPRSNSAKLDGASRKGSLRASGGLIQSSINQEIAF
jgi:hypothetical protein